MKILYPAVAATLLAAGAAQAALVDLSTWTAEGPGSWNLEPGNNVVYQTLNGGPTFFSNSDASSQGKSLSGTIEVRTSADNDFIGFVLGYDVGDLDRATADYLIVDWKKGDQSGWDQGLAISRVNGDISSSPNVTNPAWTHTAPVALVTRANAPGAILANTGWNYFQRYSFDLEFTATNVKVFVDGNLEIDVDAGATPFSDGGFGFYNFSQASVRYAGITEGVLAPVPVPAALPLMLIGMGALGLVARRRARG
jgi:hypothetical protein